MDAAELKLIAEWLEAAGLHSIEISGPGHGVRIVMAKDDDAPAPPIEDGAQASSPEVSEPGAILAPGPGVFLAAHPSRSTPFVHPADIVKRGGIAGLLKIGRICVPVTAPRDGVVGLLLAEPGALVGFGTPLMQFHPAAPMPEPAQGKD